MKKFLKRYDILYKLFMLSPLLTAMIFSKINYIVLYALNLPHNELYFISEAWPFLTIFIYIFGFGQAYKERNKKIVLIFAAMQVQAILTFAIVATVVIWKYFSTPALDLNKSV